MRMRKKKHCAERMAACAELVVGDAARLKGQWQSEFGGGRVHLEIGCGKGAFAEGMARLYPDVNFAAVEKVKDVLVLAMERVRAAGLKNVRFISCDADKLCDIFAPGEVERIYLNFSDPWKKSKHAKRRLTHERFLKIYAELLPKGGEVWFKTDNPRLFEFSLNSFSENGWRMKNITLDLHNSGFRDNVMTEYEARFSAAGMPIYRLEAVRPE